MRILKSIKRMYIAHKFASANLNIIQDIPAGILTNILNKYLTEGWELVTDYQDFDGSFAKWNGKLRKGSIILIVDWNQQEMGEIVGPERVIFPMSKDFQLEALKQPK